MSWFRAKKNPYRHQGQRPRILQSEKRWFCGVELRKGGQHIVHAISPIGTGATPRDAYVNWRDQC